MYARISRWWAGAAVVGALLAVAAGAVGAFRAVELTVRDAIQRTLPRRPPSHVAAVVVDEAALAQEGRWPWSRGRLADLVGTIHDAGALGVVIDVLLLEPGIGDEALIATLATVPAVLVATFDDRASGWLAPRPPLRTAGRLAHGMFELDRDGVFRRLVATKQAAGVSLPALAVAGAAIASPSLAVPVGRTLIPAFRSPPATMPRISAADLLRGADASILKGRVAFVGLSAAGLGDRVVTPMTVGPVPDPGVLVQAATTEALITGDLLHPLAPLLLGLPALLLVGAVGAASTLGGVRRLVVEAALLAAPTVLALACLHLGSILVPAVALTSLTLLTVLGAELRAGLLAWQHAGTTAALLGAAAGAARPSGDRTFEGRLELVETLATEAARRRVADEESARVLAHELKTPLTSVRGLGQMLRDLDLSADERRRAADLLVTEADRLHALIEHLTELERLPRRSLDESATEVDLSSLVRRRAEVLGDGHSRATDIDVVPGLRVRGDSRLLDRVLDNLLGNAFKFSPPSSLVEVRASRSGGTAVVEVRDHGCGITAEEQGTIFQRFVRGSAAQGREGMGLGLALVSEVVTWHRGRVEVNSEPGDGSVFTVTLPLRQEESERGDDPRRR